MELIVACSKRFGCRMDGVKVVIPALEDGYFRSKLIRELLGV